ncbi:hypothetical protein [Cohnella rhizosphaerae]|uniref:Uncharacterized protein n=1 Tax=Cohnella rhizosphaerae TaxID=1457232 RepID=A0A9X4KPA5_9BACL|nr:hypothetical protein [Cohnella rhizosphaerae]MDG0808263.1 hypothetical protein [Cohnella rhizosphaerae]
MNEMPIAFFEKLDEIIVAHIRQPAGVFDGDAPGNAGFNIVEHWLQPNTFYAVLSREQPHFVVTDHDEQYFFNQQIDRELVASFLAPRLLVDLGDAGGRLSPGDGVFLKQIVHRA